MLEVEGFFLFVVWGGFLLKKDEFFLFGFLVFLLIRKGSCFIGCL